MAVYDYECQNAECGAITENVEIPCSRWPELSDPPLAACPKCGEEVRRLVGRPQVPDWCQDSKMSAEEKLLHVTHMRDMEAQHAAGTLLDYKRGRKTPSDMIPAFDK